MLELTITSPYLKVDECFPNYSKKEQPIGNLGKGAKGRVKEMGLEGVEADFFPGLNGVANFI
jgi:hypothetical protein